MNADVFERCARGEITPEQAADEILQRREDARPRWMSRRTWRVLNRTGDIASLACWVVVIAWTISAIVQAFK